MKVTLPEWADLRTLPGKKPLFHLLSPYGGTVGGRPFIVPQGFVTDLASVPQVFQNLIPNDDPDILRAAILHDWLYQHQGSIPGQDLYFTRLQSDNILWAGMTFIDGAFWKRPVSWSAVRLFGSTAWDHYKIRRVCLAVQLKTHPDF